MIKNQELSSLPSLPAVAAMNKHNGINRVWESKWYHSLASSSEKGHNFYSFRDNTATRAGTVPA